MQNFAADSDTMAMLNQFRSASADLQMQGFKVETVLNMMNNCADRCELPYFETGIKDASQPTVECFKNCLAKSYKLGAGSLE
jgi:hypothetical protein